jgi:Putative DNA-binding domain
MPHTWSRLHEHLGSPPGPVDFSMVRRCADDGLVEADDLDWKEKLPNQQDPRTPAEFAKDVAAMANTRGGLIIYGVADQPVAFKGIQEADANRDQYAQWVRNFVQPYLSGLDMYCLAADDGSEAVLVVDIPASELAPHSVHYEPTIDRARSQRSSVTPYRDGAHTDWMAEHQIARAYAERLTRTAQWQESFNQLRDWTAESLDGRLGPGNALLLFVARPTRPIPRSSPRLDRAVAKQIIDEACRNPVITFEPKISVLQGLANERGNISVGLNAWVISNRRWEGEYRPREVTAALHHDGSLVLVVNLSQHTLRDPSDEEVGVVNLDAVEQACIDVEALLLQTIRTERIDSPVRVQANVVSEIELPLKCAIRDFGGYVLTSSGLTLHRFRPVTVELPVGATEAHTQVAATELASGILNQFGVGCQLSRYVM